MDLGLLSPDFGLLFWMLLSFIIVFALLAKFGFPRGGPQEAKDRARKFMTNAAVNAVAIGKSFSPLEGTGENSENQFVYTNEDGVTYYAVFNYTESDNVLPIPFARMGIDNESVKKITELWSGETVAKDSQITVPAKDVKLYKIEN